MFYCSVQDVISVLIDHKWTVQLIQYFLCPYHCLTIIIGKSNIQCLTAPYDLRKCPHCLFQWCLRIHSVMIKNIHIRQSHTLQTLIETGNQIFSASKITVRSFPHIKACLGTDDQFIPIGTHFFPQDPSQITFRASRNRSVFIGKIKVSNAMVKGCKTHLLHILIIIIRAKIMPKPQ